MEAGKASFGGGLTPQQVEDSRRRHGNNVLTPPPRDPWWKLYRQKFDDPVIRLLMIAAAIAVVVGAADRRYIEALGIILAILLATLLAFINEYRAEAEFEILNRANDDVSIRVFRDGYVTTVPRRDLVVGDLVLIETGEAVPADGDVLQAVSLQVDESSLTGESAPVTKTAGGADRTAVRGAVDQSGADGAAGDDAPGDGIYPAHRLLRGTWVTSGHGLFRVAEVGDSTETGRIAHSEEESEEEKPLTPLNAQLQRLSKLIGVVGFAVAAATFAALIVRGTAAREFVLNPRQWVFFALLLAGVLAALTKVWLPIAYDAVALVRGVDERPDWLEAEGYGGWMMTLAAGTVIFVVGLLVCRVAGWVPLPPGDWLTRTAGAALLRYFMVAVTLIVVAVPEGLAMSVTLSLAYSMRKMTASNNLVRKPHACETIGSATVICSDKTGTLTTGEMGVYAVDVPGDAARGEAAATSSASAASDPPAPAFASRLLAEAVSVNSTAHLGRAPGESLRSLGKATEGALLLWLERQGTDYAALRSAFGLEEQFTFSPEHKYMGTLGHSAVTGKRILHVKGAVEVVLARCDNLLTAQGILPKSSHEAEIERLLHDYQARGMRTLGFAYREIEDGEEGASAAAGANAGANGQAPAGTTVEDEKLARLARGMTWLGLVAISDPLRTDVPDAIRACRRAGIEVKIVTGDSAATAREIGKRIGLLGNHPAPSALPLAETATAGVPVEDGEAHAQMSGAALADLSDEELLARTGQLKILSRARPLDKLRLVKALQHSGHVVAVTGDGTNDVPALRHADVGLSMGRTGTAVAKEASDIVLLDDSFASVVNAVIWGRSLYQNIQRFILFQLTINVAAMAVALAGPFIGVEIPLTVPQMLWINLIMDTFAALALATEPADPAVMGRPPRGRNEFIITRSMGRFIFAVGGLFAVFLIAFLCHSNRGGLSAYRRSVFYACFVLLQFWNLFNARRLGSDKSALVGLSSNRLFLLIAVAILVGQVVITQVGGKIFSTVPLSPRDWLLILAGTSAVLWTGEVVRYVRRSGGVGRRPPDPIR